MRQSGILAAACLHALDHHIEQLHNDHLNAKLIAEKLAESKHIRIDLATVQTNIVIFDLNDSAPSAEEVVARAQKYGVEFFAFGPRTIRLVTHRDITQSQCLEAVSLILKAVEA